MALYAMLARGIYSGKVDRAVLPVVHKEGTVAYYSIMPMTDKIWFHKHRAAVSKRHRLYQAAVYHYDKLRELQGWNWKIALKRWLVSVKSRNPKYER